MHPNLIMFLDARENARAVGDRGLERALTADLHRIGYREPKVVTVTGMETTAVRAPEQAIPQHRPREKRAGGRPPLPRCPHNKIAGRCTKCPKP